MFNKTKIYILKKWINGPRHILSKIMCKYYNFKIKNNPHAIRFINEQHKRFKLVNFPIEAKLYIENMTYKSDFMRGKFDWSGNYPVVIYRNGGDCDDFSIICIRLLDAMYGPGKGKSISFLSSSNIKKAHVMAYYESDEGRKYMMDYNTIKEIICLNDMKRYYNNHYLSGKEKIENIITIDIPEVDYPTGIIKE